ncbi:septal ring lytic transglycosylase RlpA family protein [Cytophaga aurantiaca]|uniref:septal ring lytic transglycosylase RlpA family protein n=1 Tax=Cytophaga aurantiaca TaxID=29530 RepID=UPI000379598E|nr:septal ring lytic transglycosylase RlpA family protein [Cytophaga aurantiaca]
MKVLRNFRFKTNILIIKNIPFILLFTILLIFSLHFEGLAQTEAASGSASYYANKFQGRKTASGEKYDKNKLTAAHRTYAFGTKLKVTNIANGKSVVVTVNDRGPYAKQRLIDLSYAAAKHIDMIKQGVAEVHIEVVSNNYEIPSSPTKKQHNSGLAEGYYSKSLIPIDPPKGHLLQVGSFSLQENALKRIEELKSMNIGQACIQVVTVRRKKVFRVLYSGFHSKEAITQKKAELKKKGIDSIIIDNE